MSHNAMNTNQITITTTNDGTSSNLVYTQPSTTSGSTIFVGASSSPSLRIAWDEQLADDFLDFVEKHPKLAERLSKIIAAAIHGT